MEVSNLLLLISLKGEFCVIILSYKIENEIKLSLFWVKFEINTGILAGETFLIIKRKTD